MADNPFPPLWKNYGKDDEDNRVFSLCVFLCFSVGYILQFVQDRKEEKNRKRKHSNEHNVYNNNADSNNNRYENRK
jgi:hypothetical protein